MSREEPPPSTEQPQQAGDPQGEADRSDDDWDDLESDPCAVGERGHWVDWMNRTATRSVCSTARWFDNFFGTTRGDEERDATFGRIGVGVGWDEDDGFELLTRFRAKLHFPRSKGRFGALLGHGPEDEFVDEDEVATETARDLIFDEESEFLLGFGYQLVKTDRNRLTLGIGASFSGGVDPYFRIRHIYRQPVGQHRSFRMRLTPMWQESRGLGAIARFSLDRSIGSRLLIRYEVSGKAFEKKFDGVAYGGGVVLYQNLGNGRGIRYGVAAFGESDKEIPLEDIGFLISYRQLIYKETLFIELFGGTSWRRREVEEEREPKAILGLGFELRFGQ